MDLKKYLPPHADSEKLMIHYRKIKEMQKNGSYRQLRNTSKYANNNNNQDFTTKNYYPSYYANSNQQLTNRNTAAATNVDNITAASAFLASNISQTTFKDITKNLEAMTNASANQMVKLPEFNQISQQNTNNIAAKSENVTSQESSRIPSMLTERSMITSSLLPQVSDNVIDLTMSNSLSININKNNGGETNLLAMNNSSSDRDTVSINGLKPKNLDKFHSLRLQAIDNQIISDEDDEDIDVVDVNDNDNSRSLLMEVADDTTATDSSINIIPSHKKENHLENINSELEKRLGILQARLSANLDKMGNGKNAAEELKKSVAKAKNNNHNHNSNQEMDQINPIRPPSKTQPLNTIPPFSQSQSQTVQNQKSDLLQCRISTYIQEIDKLILDNNHLILHRNQMVKLSNHVLKAKLDNNAMNDMNTENATNSLKKKEKCLERVQETLVNLQPLLDWLITQGETAKSFHSAINTKFTDFENQIKIDEILQASSNSNLSTNHNLTTSASDMSHNCSPSNLIQSSTLPNFDQIPNTTSNTSTNTNNNLLQAARINKIKSKKAKKLSVLANRNNRPAALNLTNLTGNKQMFDDKNGQKVRPHTVGLMPGQTPLKSGKRKGDKLFADLSDYNNNNHSNNSGQITPSTRSQSMLGNMIRTNNIMNGGFRSDSKSSLTSSLTSINNFSTLNLAQNNNNISNLDDIKEMKESGKLSTGCQTAQIFTYNLGEHDETCDDSILYASKKMKTNSAVALTPAPSARPSVTAISSKSISCLSTSAKQAKIVKVAPILTISKKDETNSSKDEKKELRKTVGPITMTNPQIYLNSKQATATTINDQLKNLNQEIRSKSSVQMSSGGSNIVEKIKEEEEKVTSPSSCNKILQTQRSSSNPSLKLLDYPKFPTKTASPNNQKEEKILKIEKQEGVENGSYFQFPEK